MAENDSSAPTDSAPGHDTPVSTATTMHHKHRPQSRREPRKPVVLMGMYRHDGQSDTIPVVVEDLSQSGVGLLSFTPDSLAANDILHLQFDLEDENHTMIEALVCVRWVKHDIFGTEFVNPDTLPHAFFDFLRTN